MRNRFFLLGALFCFALGAAVIAENANREAADSIMTQPGEATKDKKEAKGKDEKKAKGKDEKKELTLEKLFPKKSFFGPSARSIAFSHDGKYAAWLYRPYRERRHGSDLYVLDVEKGKPRRVTVVSVMAEFQKNARKVRDDRIKRAKAELEKKRKEAKDEKEKEELKLTDEQKRGDWVTDADADINDDDEEEEKEEEKKDGEDKKKKKEKAPTYGGVSSYDWSETADELIFNSGGDLYRYEVRKDRITRLTRTKEAERSVAWLPDGKGYTHVRGSSIVKVVFGDHRTREINLGLPDGESLSRYKLSPDGRSIALLVRKELPPPGKQKEFAIAKYRERTMKTQTLTRGVADDPLKPVEYVAYLCKINDPMEENTRLIEVHRHKIESPRDRVTLPDWAPDSSRAVFMVWEHTKSQISLMEATFPEEKKEKEKEDKEKGGGDKVEEKRSERQKKEDKEKSKGEERDKKDGDVKEKKKEKGKKKDGDEKPKKEEEPDKPKVHKARLLLKFMHTGGPNTPRMIRPRYMADSRRVVFLSEQTGFRHLHVLDPPYEAVEPLTKGYYEVYPLTVTKKRDWMFFSATKEHPSRLDVYRLSLDDGATSRLTPQRGRYLSAAVSPDGTKVLANFVRFGKLPELVLIDAETKKQKTLTDSHPPVAHELTEPKPEFFRYKNRHGQQIHGTLFKPEDWKKEDKRPLLIYLYGGPLGTKKQVEDGNYDSSGYFFGYYMAQKHGYLTATIDPRGCSGYGAVFEKANYERVGKPQIEDLVDGVKFLVKKYGVDPKRVALHGWSFGGFQTQMCMYTKPDVFAAGIAGAGPTEWENYNSWYTRGTVGESRVGTPDLKKFSLLPLAKKLKGHLLLVHGVEDTNVLYQDTVRVYRELLKAKKETLVELFIDPTGGHGLGGDVKRLARYRKYEQFLLRTIGKWEPEETEKKSSEK